MCRFAPNEEQLYQKQLSIYCGAVMEEYEEELEQAIMKGKFEDTGGRRGGVGAGFVGRGGSSRCAGKFEDTGGCRGGGGFGVVGCGSLVVLYYCDAEGAGHDEGQV